ncbi:MAG: DUF1080 domain-containing protein [Bacteroidota bacterium]
MTIWRLLGILCCSIGFMVGNNCTTEPSLSLIQGDDLSGWYMDVPLLDSVPNGPQPFYRKDGLLITAGEPRGHLLTKATYRDYRLEVEYRFLGEPGNCGVLVHASTPRALYDMFPQSIEVQMEHGNAGDFWVIVEDIKVAEMEKRRGPRSEWGITEGKQRRIKRVGENPERPLGEWNSMTIVCKADTIKVWVNGALVNSGYQATVSEGKIAVQAEGAAVAFRKMVLTPL